MKWLLVALLIGIVVSRRHLVGDVIGALRKAPKSYREGKKRIEDPAASAKPVPPEPSSSKPVSKDARDPEILSRDD